jgi:uncharacterized protein (UPF0218 family)
MKADYTLTPRLRVYFKEPFGTLIEGTPEETMGKLKEIIATDKPPRIITVGDVVSQNIHESGMQPQLSVIDYISLRDQAMPRQAPVEKTVYVHNPQGTISDEAACAIKTALEADVHTHVVVDGEEDLLTLIAVLFAPQNSFIVYGQPYRGIVIVKASKKKKAEVKRLLNEMKSSKS